MTLTEQMDAIANAPQAEAQLYAELAAKHADHEGYTQWLKMCMANDCIYAGDVEIFVDHMEAAENYNELFDPAETWDRFMAEWCTWVQDMAADNEEDNDDE